jgi:hypothetical protein
VAQSYVKAEGWGRFLNSVEEKLQGYRREKKRETLPQKSGVQGLGQSPAKEATEKKEDGDDNAGPYVDMARLPVLDGGEKADGGDHEQEGGTLGRGLGKSENEDQGGDNEDRSTDAKKPAQGSSGDAKKA